MATRWRRTCWRATLHNSSARLTLGVRDIKAKSYSAARKELSSGATGRQRDLTAVLLTAWSYVGSGDVKKALSIVDSLNEPSFAVFRDFHAGLMLDAAGKAEEAGKRLQAAYASDQSTLRLVDAYGRNLSRQGKAAEAKAVYDAFEKVQPRNPLVEAAQAELASGKKLDPMVKDVSDGARRSALRPRRLWPRRRRQPAGRRDRRHRLPAPRPRACSPSTRWRSTRSARPMAGSSNMKRRSRSMTRRRNRARCGPTPTSTSPCCSTPSASRTRRIKRLQGIVAEHPDNAEALSALADLERSRKDFSASADAYSRVLA